MRIKPTAAVRLVHIRSYQKIPGYTLVRYVIQTVHVDRPARGSRTGRVHCQVCGRWVGVRVDSAPAARRRRRWACAAGGLFGAVAVIGFIELATHLDDSGEIGGGVATASLFTASTCLVLMLIAGLLAALEDGVRWNRKDRQNIRRHGFKPMGIRQALRHRPADRNPPEIVFDP